MKAKAPKKTITTKKAVKAPKAGRKTVGKSSPSTQLLTLLVQALEGKKAEDLRILNVSKLSSITDYLVLASGNSEPHLRALRIELERVLDEEKARILGVDTTKGSGWVVVDAFEIMIHLFTPENREKYRMESLWKDAVELPVKTFLR